MTVKLKNIRLMYNPQSDEAVLVKFICGKPVEAMDCTQYFVHAIVQWVKEDEMNHSVKRRWLNRLKRFIGIPTGVTRTITAANGTGYSITLNEKGGKNEQ